MKIRNSRYARLLILLLLFVDRVLAGNWVELLGLVLLTRVLFYLVIVTSIVHVTFPDAFFVAE